jgi:hypothetical protein
MGVSGQLHAPAACSHKNIFQDPLDRNLGKRQSRFGGATEGKIPATTENM